MVRHKQNQSKYAGHLFLRLCSGVVFGVAEWERHYRRANWPGKYGWRSLPPAHWPPPPTIALVSPDLLHLLAPAPQPLVARGSLCELFPPSWSDCHFDNWQEGGNIVWQHWLPWFHLNLFQTPLFWEATRMADRKTSRSLSTQVSITDINLKLEKYFVCIHSIWINIGNMTQQYDQSLSQLRLSSRWSAQAE